MKVEVYSPLDETVCPVKDANILISLRFSHEVLAESGDF